MTYSIIETAKLAQIKGALKYAKTKDNKVLTDNAIDAIDTAKPVEERGWYCQNKKHPATKCIAMNPQVSDAYTEVTPLYAIKETP